MRALWLPDVLRSAGLNVIETDGWQTRGKELDGIEGVVSHHTASPPLSTLSTNLSVVTNGNGVAPGPIAQLLLWRTGTFYAVASGKANHAGAGGPWGWLPLSPPGQLSTANARTIGIEAVNSGVGEPWAPEMIDAYERGIAAILRYLGQGVDRALTHHEWAPSRKIDPAGPTGGLVATLPKSQTWDGNAWRARIAAHLTPPSPPVVVPTPPPTQQTSEDIVLKLIVEVPGDLTRTAALVLMDGAGTEMIGSATAADRAMLVIAAGVPVQTCSAAQYDDFIAHRSARLPV